MRNPAQATGKSEEERMFFEETLYLRDDEADEFGDSGAFNDSIDADYEEEEEEEEAEVTPSAEIEHEPAMDEEPEPSPSAPRGGGSRSGGGGSKPVKKKSS